MTKWLVIIAEYRFFRHGICATWAKQAAEIGMGLCCSEQSIALPDSQKIESRVIVIDERFNQETDKDKQEEMIHLYDVEGHFEFRFTSKGVKCIRSNSK